MLKRDKKYCIGCNDDYYNHGNNSATGECWLFEKAKVVTKYCIGWWTPMDKASNFWKVTTHDCHKEPGSFAFCDKLPEHLRRK
jgi:hypothetical protein